MIDRKTRLNNIREAIKRDKLKGEEIVRLYWESLPIFEIATDVPSLPVVEEKEWKEYYIPKLIAAGAIPKDQLVDGEFYYGRHRCTNYGQWNAKDQVFNYWKLEMFGYCWDRCNHFEDDDHYALFVPIAVTSRQLFDASGQRTGSDPNPNK
jgi:hypothetical protein